MDATLVPIRCPVSRHVLMEVEAEGALSPPAQIICRCGLRLRLLATNHIVILGAKAAPVRIQ